MANHMKPEEKTTEQEPSLSQEEIEYQPRRMRMESPPSPGAGGRKKKGGAVLWVLLIIAILVFLVSGFMVLRELVLLPAQADSDNAEIRAVAQGETSSTTEGGVTQSVNFAALRSVNSDIIGWIQIPNTQIDYPVLQSSTEDPEYYLTHNYKKEESKYGSIFLDANASIHSADGNSKSLTLYGHHMNDGRMFADLLKYSDLDFYKSAPTFTFDTYEETGTWKVISVFKTNVEESQGSVFQYVRNGFSDRNDFLDFVYQIKIRSILDTGVTVNETDQLLVLSTCSYEFENFRTVVVARKVRENESTAVDTTQASYRSAPLYPDCWYENGGTKPEYPSTFAQAKAQGEVSWYDGQSA